MPLVSVIIPNYNHGRFLHERMQSVLAQRFDDYEIILLDDASTDNSRMVLESFRSHPKVKTILYNSQNSGLPFQQWCKRNGTGQRPMDLDCRERRQQRT